MNDDIQIQANPGYAAGQMAKAFVTALTHEDEQTRRRAEERLRRWNSVLSGMSAGTLSIGSRTPVKGMPAWVTPEVVSGGFATGEAVAGGPALPHELDDLRRIEATGGRGDLFLHYLTDDGQAELHALLDGGHYEITVPEEAALLVVAWLLRAGDRVGALEVLEEIGPFADRLRFLPRPAEKAQDDSSLVQRQTVGEVRGRIAAKRPNTAVAAMKEALGVWNPFGDRLLAHWLETVQDGRVRAVEPEGWRERGAELMEQYRRLADEHTLCSKHLNPKENLGILLLSLEAVLEGREPLRLLGRTVEGMVAKRGLPGSPELTELRARQADEAARPTHHALAQIVLARLSEVPQDTGVPSTEPFTAPVTDDEARRTGVPAGSPLPDRIRRIVENALQAPIGTLVERGIVPSASVLADLVPQLVASTTALSYPDEALRTLMAANYRAFRNRRSLLLVNLQSQVRLEELPWVRAVERYRRKDETSTENAHAALTRLGELTLQGFPATILPNPLLRELSALARQAGVDVPFVEELGADIFMGTFSPKFLRAAQFAAEVMEGTLYERYYAIDYAEIRDVKNVHPVYPPNTQTSRSFVEICHTRVVLPEDIGGSWVAANGMMIEQAQILTTHNLAALVYPIGVDPSPGWPDLARRAFATVCRLVAQIHDNPRPLPTIKDAAYAWRQTLFFLSLCGLKDQIAVTASLQDELDRHPAHTVARLDPVLNGLRHVLVGGSLDDGSAPTAQRFTGWQVGGHWMRQPV